MPVGAARQAALCQRHRHTSTRTYAYTHSVCISCSAGKRQQAVHYTRDPPSPLGRPPLFSSGPPAARRSIRPTPTPSRDLPVLSDAAFRILNCTHHGYLQRPAPNHPDLQHSLLLRCKEFVAFLGRIGHSHWRCSGSELPRIRTRDLEDLEISTLFAPLAAFRRSLAVHSTATE